MHMRVALEQAVRISLRQLEVSQPPQLRLVAVPLLLECCCARHAPFRLSFAQRTDNIRSSFLLAYGLVEVPYPLPMLWI